MKSLLGAVFLVTLALPLFAEDISVYNDHGRRDPLWSLVSPSGEIISYDNDLTIGDLALEGILLDDAGKSLALINKRVVKLNDKIGPFVIAEIGRDRVILTRGNEKFVLKMKKED